MSSSATIDLVSEKEDSSCAERTLSCMADLRDVLLKGAAQGADYTSAVVRGIATHWLHAAYIRDSARTKTAHRPHWTRFVLALIDQLGTMDDRVFAFAASQGIVLSNSASTAIANICRLFSDKASDGVRLRADYDCDAAAQFFSSDRCMPVANAVRQ